MRLRPLALTACAALLVLGSCTPPAASDDRRDRIAELYAESRQSFPDVPEVTPEELLAAAADRYVLVDVREPEEQAVSRIPGALTVAELEARLADPDGREELAGREVLTYCTLGHRSGLYAQELRAQGYEAKNLAGSLLAWTHADGPLVTPEGEPTKRVHVYGKRWDLAADGYESTW